MDSVQQIGRAAGRFFSGTMVSRVTGLARDIAMAAAFGASPLVAAFLVAFRFANLPRRLFGEGAMHSAFVPRFEQLRAEDPARGARFFRDLSLTLFLSLIGVVLLAELALWKWGSGSIASLTMWILPAIPFVCLYGLNSALLNCERSYFLPSVAPAGFNLVWIGAALWLTGRPEAMPTLAFAVGCALIVQWAFTVPPVWRLMGGIKGARPWTEDVRRLVRPLGLAILGIGAMQINSALDPLFARFADPSGPAYLWYAIRLQQLPLALFGIGLSTALLPPLSRAVKQGQLGEARRYLGYVRKRATLWMLLCTLAIFVGGGLAVQLLFGHGQFDAEAVRATTHCLWAYGLGLIPMVLVLIETAACQARGNYRLPAIASAYAVLFNVILNALFVFVLDFGALSVALSTSISSCLHLSKLLVSSDM